MDKPPQTLPGHIEETIRSIAKLQAAHEERAAPLQRGVNRLTGLVARPQFLLAIACFVFLWIAANLNLMGIPAFDPPPYSLLQTLATLAALCVTAVILATQRYADELAGYREQLTLELAILTEQKASKLIALLEEQRRDNPYIRDRADPEARAMGTPSNPEAVLDAIKQAQGNLDRSASEDAKPDVSRGQKRNA
jgi:uncharacterized membrane protein